jgi:hypothetical protein
MVLYFCRCTLEVFDLKNRWSFMKTSWAFPSQEGFPCRTTGDRVFFFLGRRNQAELMETRKEGAWRGAAFDGFSVPSLDEKLRFVTSENLRWKVPFRPIPYPVFLYF